MRADERCELFTIVGEAGVGKSRLVSEALASEDSTVVLGRCLPYGEGITYWPVVEVLKQLAVVPPNEAAAATVDTLLGDASKARRELGWAPKVSFDELVRDMVTTDLSLARRDSLVMREGYRAVPPFE